MSKKKKHHNESQLEGIPKLTVEEVLEMDVIKLDLGGGARPAQGYINVDVQYHPGVDLIMDARELDKHFPAKSIDGLSCRDTLQCFKFTELKGILRRWHKVLKPRGRLVIQCYDFQQIADGYVNAKCECWKASTRKADPGCPKCQGKAIMNDAHARSMIFGSLKDEHRTHYNLFDEAYLMRMLQLIGFTILEVTHPPMRIKMVAIKEK